MRALLLSALLALLAGCAAPGVPDAPDGPAPRAAAVYGYACPGDVRGEPCPAVVRASGGSLQEPALARRGGLAALGVISGDAGALLDATLTLAASATRIEVFLSRDGGPWTPAGALPLPDAPGLRTLGDPSLAFDARDGLHVTAMSGSEIVHWRSGDGGATWSAPRALSAPGADRNWIVAAPDGALAVSWQRPSERAEGAVSRDQGGTWTPLAPVPGCVTVSPVVAVEGRLLAACTRFEGERDVAVEVGAWGEAWTPLATLASMTGAFPRLAAAPDGSLVVAATERERGTVLLARTGAEGAWGAPLDLRALASGDDGWTRATLYALAVDGHGAAHALLRGFVDRDGPAGLGLSGKAGTLHLVVAPDGALLLETPLAVEPATPDPSAPALQWSDDFGEAVAHEGGVDLAWGAGGVVRVARVVATPVPPREAYK